ncbi:50S ribosomal protein L31 [Blochmannia endosymbiont of Polyrhachis (Hedomyrma) turneri]|uniref:50S ribosomal protein L31 n=1 Tax=Blochmannia endosymbiont of Polyrhachis (Hedomyrma) turneri TaxID=1505596 RepID=UPI00061A7517|nr:50S ribosomal protein L31 [Blochmannia endosymbiont of Polyrhachis (Hedomyrma) turneri]AKC60151.1 50S ribosomal protein L31 [Blochmannia endosymbiont of Polyrhachis (Hedomyrma) turneri]
MKYGIHPKYGKITAVCSCGNVISVKSTLSRDIVLDVCCACHPFYTGKQRTIDSHGRINKFNKRFNMLFRS